MTKRMSGVKGCSHAAVHLHVGAATSTPLIKKSFCTANASAFQWCVLAACFGRKDLYIFATLTTDHLLLLGFCSVVSWLCHGGGHD